MADDILLCRVDDIPDPGSKGFEVDDLEGFLVRRGDTIRAYRDSCPHTGVPLAWAPGNYLDSDDALIQCAFHGALFVIETGECVHGPCVGRSLEPLPIRVEAGAILLDASSLDDIG